MASPWCDDSLLTLTCSPFLSYELLTTRFRSRPGGLATRNNQLTNEVDPLLWIMACHPHASCTKNDIVVDSSSSDSSRSSSSGRSSSISSSHLGVTRAVACLIGHFYRRWVGLSACLVACCGDLTEVKKVEDTLSKKRSTYCTDR